MERRFFVVAAVLVACCSVVVVQAAPQFRPPADRAPPVFGNVNFVPEKVSVNSTVVRSITRAAVMKRAREWVEKKMPYCQCNGPEECCGHCPYCGSYRCDCSGYVSWCWDAGHGYVTQTLHEIAHRVDKHELKPGDIMLYAAEHVVLFGGWKDNRTKTEYHAFQEPGCHENGPHYAFESIVPYPMNWDPNMFLPYRYNHIVD